MTWGLARWAEWRTLAPLSRLGLLILFLGAVADTVAHVDAGPLTTAATNFTPPQQSAHLVILIGMVCILLGIILNVIWPPRREQLRKL